MSIDSAVRSILPASTAPAQALAGNSAGSAPAAQSGSRVQAAAASEIAEPVAPVAGASGMARVQVQQVQVQRVQLQDAYPGEAARARIDAAQRAYMMTLRAAGLSPLSNRVA